MSLMDATGMPVGAPGGTRTTRAPAPPAVAAGSWQGRPAGVPGAVPPPSIPLSFLAAASLGLVGCGGAWVWARTAALGDPTADPVVAAAHFGMLATLSMGVLGALHQFTPVVAQRPLRSVRLARVTFITWLAAAWLLPFGFATGHEWLVEAGGASAALAVTVLVVNLSAPLAARHKGAPLAGLRLALAGFVATACFGVLYVADRSGNWFDLSGHVVLAHALVGLFAWIGLTYVSVAEKLWPMFFLAHVPGRRRAPWVAVVGVPAGVVLTSPGVLLGWQWLAALGAAVTAIGLGAHVASFGVVVRHRRRRADLHLAFVVTSALWLVAGALLALAAAVVVPRHHHAGVALAAAAIAAFGGWLLETLVGHAHKVVPFICWSALRARGVEKSPGGRPLLFADLYNHTAAAVTFGLVTAGVSALCLGLGAELPDATAAGGVLFVATGLLSAANLSIRPIRLLATRPGDPDPLPPGSGPGVGAPAIGSSGAAPADAPASRPGSLGAPSGGSGQRPPGDGRSTALSLVALAVASVAVIMAAAVVWSEHHGAGTAPAAIADAGPVVPNGEIDTVTVRLREFSVAPSSITVSAGTRLVLTVVNDGTMQHDLQLEGGPIGSGMLAPGQRRSVDFGVVGRSEQAWCTLPGHKEAGMVLHIGIARGVRSPTASAAPAAATADATIDFSAVPPPGWQPYDPVVPPAPEGTIHHVTLVAEDRLLQVAPGVTQRMWTFDGQVPGPTLRGHVGDVFDVTLVNHSSMDHSIDVHAANEPMQQMVAVAPGQSVTYQFRAEHAGIFLYHCGTAPVLEHVANGMYGAVIIDPPGLRPVAHEYLIVQSELYLGPQDQSGDDAKMLRGQPDAVVFDGYVDQYMFAPLRVRAGDRVRIWVLDAGPSDDTSFHVVGTQFDTVFKEGVSVLQPGNSVNGAAQALDLSPGQGGFVELTVPAPGTYELLDHHLDHAATGAAGQLIAS